MAEILNFQNNSENVDDAQERILWLTHFVSDGLQFSIADIESSTQVAEKIFKEIPLDEFEKMAECPGQKALFQKFKEDESNVIEIFYLMLRDYRKIKKSIFLASHIAAKLFGAKYAVKLFQVAEINCRDECDAECAEIFFPKDER